MTTKQLFRSEQRALAIRKKLFGEEHESTDDSSSELGVTQQEMHDYKAALQPHHRALAVRIKLFRQEHESIADSYKGLGTTQHEMHLLQSSSSFSPLCISCSY